MIPSLPRRHFLLFGATTSTTIIMLGIGLALSPVSAVMASKQPQEHPWFSSVVTWPLMETAALALFWHLIYAATDDDHYHTWLSKTVVATGFASIHLWGGSVLDLVFRLPLGIFLAIVWTDCRENFRGAFGPTWLWHGAYNLFMLCFSHLALAITK